MSVVIRGVVPRPKRINTLFDAILQTDSAGIIGRDHLKAAFLGALQIKQRGSCIMRSWIFRPYYDTIGGLLYNDALMVGGFNRMLLYSLERIQL